MNSEQALGNITRVRDFYLMCLASETLDQGLEQMEQLNQDAVVANFCANGASMFLTVRDVIGFLDGVRELELRRRKITDALASPPDLPHLDQPLQGPAG